LSAETKSVMIAENGRPAAKLVVIDLRLFINNLDIAKGKLVVPESIDMTYQKTAKLFICR